MSVKYPFANLATVNEPLMPQLIEAASSVIRSGRYIGGPEVDTLEQNMASLCSTSHAVGVSNGLDALRLILEAMIELGRLQSGDGVIVPANTYIASVLAITHAGLTPVLVDPDVNTMNLSAAGLQDGIAQGAKAVMTVHLYGRVAWDEEMERLAQEAGLQVVEDAAQAIGAIGIIGSTPRPTGAIGHAAGFSFYPTKNVGALGDAGCVTTNDAALADTVRALANYGSDRRYHNLYAGHNCRLDPIQAAMLNVKLPHTAEANARRFERAVAYNNTIVNPAVILPAMPSSPTECVWHQYVVRVPGHRDEFRQYLTAHGVETDIHYPIPPHLQPCYMALPHSPLPVAEQLATEVVSLPITDCTSVSDAVEIAKIINRYDPTK